MSRHTPQREILETFLSAPAHRILDWFAPESGDEVSDVGRLALELEEPQDSQEIVQSRSLNTAWCDERLMRDAYPARVENDSKMV
jgi:hypothetical protein